VNEHVVKTRSQRFGNIIDEIKKNNLIPTYPIHEYNIEYYYDGTLLLQVQKKTRFPPTGGGDLKSGEIVIGR